MTSSVHIIGYCGPFTLYTEFQCRGNTDVNQRCHKFSITPKLKNLYLFHNLDAYTYNFEQCFSLVYKYTRLIKCSFISFPDINRIALVLQCYWNEWNMCEYWFNIMYGIKSMCHINNSNDGIEVRRCTDLKDFGERK